MKEYNSAGIEIEPAFLYPCPQRCGLTAGCPSCRNWNSSEITISITTDHFKWIAENLKPPAKININ
jgi:hypothetical protein